MAVFSRVCRAVCAGLVLLGGAARADTYTIGVVPQFEALRLAEIWTPIVAELEARTGHEFELIGAPNIPTFEQEFEAGLFDFAYMNPYHSIMAQNAQGYEQILRDGSRMLYGILVVRHGSPITDVGQLDGQTVAFPAPNALEASLLMRAELDMLHDVQVNASYVSTHSSAYLNTVLGAAEAAGGVKSTFDALDEPIRQNLRILYETARVPPHPIAAHPRVPAEVVAAFQQAILDLAATEEGNALLAQIPMRQAVETSPEEYQLLRDMNLEAYVVR